MVPGTRDASVNKREQNLCAHSGMGEAESDVSRSALTVRGDGWSPDEGQRDRRLGGRVVSGQYEGQASPPRAGDVSARSAAGAGTGLGDVREGVVPAEG